MGRYIGPACRLCRREGIKLLLKGTQCETAKCQMERRQKSLAPGHARLAQGPAQRVRRSPSREAEGQALLRRVRDAVHAFFEEAERLTGQYGRDAAATARKTAGQRDLQAELCRLAQGRTPADHARSRACQRPARGYARVYRQVGDKIAIKESEKSLKKVKQQLESNPNFTTQALAAVGPGEAGSDRRGSADAGRRADPGRRAPDRGILFEVVSQNRKSGIRWHRRQSPGYSASSCVVYG